MAAVMIINNHSGWFADLDGFKIQIQPATTNFCPFVILTAVLEGGWIAYATVLVEEHPIYLEVLIVAWSIASYSLFSTEIDPCSSLNMKKAV